MRVWAIADLHLSFGVPNKSMAVFGENWQEHAVKIEGEWKKCVAPDDLVLIPGDISWAMRLEQAKVDLEWIDRLPGVKVLVKGNHDLWWGSLSKVKQILPSSLHLIQNNAFEYQGIAIAGTRLWDTDEFNYTGVIEYIPPPQSREEIQEQQRIYTRELERLELSLKAMKKEAKLRIAMVHYPPIGPTLQPTQASRLLEKYGVSICVFGHLHNVKSGLSLFANQEGIRYYLTSCDYLDFKPTLVYSSAK